MIRREKERMCAKGLKGVRGIKRGRSCKYTYFVREPSLFLWEYSNWMNDWQSFQEKLRFLSFVSVWKCVEIK